MPGYHKLKFFEEFGWLVSLFKIGFIGFGGGTALIPVIENEIVDNKKLISREEYKEDIIVASVTPGAFTVKLSAAIGKRIMGRKGMILAAACMAFPGFFVTVLLTSLLSGLENDLLKQVKFASVGIMAFIIYNILQYIKGTLAEHKEGGSGAAAKIVMVTVLLLTCEKNLNDLLGVNRIPIFSVSTIQVLIVAFFIIFYTNCRFNQYNAGAAFILSFTYLLRLGKAYTIGAQVLMLILSCASVSKSIKQRRKIHINQLKPMLSEIGVTFCFLTILIIPAMICYDGTVKFMWKGMLSSMMSFGGGDSYLTIADAMFVLDGSISHEDFYSNLVIAANALPGSILCKILSGIGYFIGYRKTGNIITGFMISLSGFACSVAASCTIMTLGNFVFQEFRESEAFQLLKKWIGTILSGLLANIVLFMVYQSMKISAQYRIHAAGGLLVLAVLFGISKYINQLPKVRIGAGVVIMGTCAIVFENIVMMYVM